MKKSTKLGFALGLTLVASGLIVYQIKQQEKQQRKEALTKIKDYFSDQGEIVTAWLFDEVTIQDEVPLFIGGVIVDVDGSLATFEFTIHAETLAIVEIKGVAND
ncbi:MAG: hypothetical protein LBS33_05705 [Streptococcaceae bacterium]|jgi:predicted small secreted protein|nr:hypothetical protein [Streptococcaceae bacterium]